MAEEKVEAQAAKAETAKAPEAQVEKVKAPEPFTGATLAPDLQFVNSIIQGGGETLKKCYQCATCSVVCNLTPNDNPSPPERNDPCPVGAAEPEPLLFTPTD